MALNWVLIAAQLLNFFALVWLLNRFLFQPARRAMAERREKLRGEVEAARRSVAEGEAAKRRYEAAMAGIEQSKTEALAEAREAADAERRALEIETRADIAALQKKWREEIEREREAFRETLREEAMAAYLSLARRALSDLAGAALDDRLAERLAEEIAAGGPELAQRLASAGPALTVRSSEALGRSARKRLESAVATAAGGERALAFTTEGAEPGEIRLSAPGVTVAWGLGPYLDDVAARVDARLGTALEELERTAR